MRDIDIKRLIQKAQELKALFILGQRVVPFLEEIFRFIEEISPLLEVINTSIADNLQKMPKASMQLSKVSEATELATTEILDTLDGLVSKSNTISTNLHSISACMPSGAGTDNDTVTALVAQSDDLLNSIRDDTTTIIMALQVQDITSQQLAAVNHLLDTVQKRLAEIVEQFREPELEPLFEDSRQTKGAKGDHTNVSHLHRSIAFDSNAIDSLNRDHGTTRQDNVDAIFAGRSGDKGDQQNSTAEPASQDDIDALFGSKPQTDAAQQEPAAEPASQDDIDALFGSKPQADAAQQEPAEPASQDDIDALFNGKPAATPPPANKAAAPKASPASPPSSSAPNNSGVSQDDIDALFNNPT